MSDFASAQKQRRLDLSCQFLYLVRYIVKALCFYNKISTHMALKTSQPLSFTRYYVERRKTKRIFLQQVNQLIGGSPIERLKEGLALSVHTTGAYAHDGLGFCLDQVKLPAGVRVLADKAYCSKAHEKRFVNQGIVSGIQRKAYRPKPLRTWAKHYNQFIGRSRYKIACMFGSIKRWFVGLEARYVGLSKTHAHVLAALAYNLYRLPGLTEKILHKNEQKDNLIICNSLTF